MHAQPFLADHRPHADADRLLDAHGPAAATEAAARADRSRTIGNHLRFCHWREVERLIGVLRMAEPAGTIH